MTEGGGIGVLVSGSGSNLQALIDAGLPVAAVASNVAGVPALERAAAAGAPTAVFALDAYPDRDSRDAAMADWLTAHDVRLVVCAGYMHLLRPVFLSRFPGRVVNVHPALLPAFPEPTPSRTSSRRARPRPGPRCTSSTKASTPAPCSRRRQWRSCRVIRPRRCMRESASWSIASSRKS